MPKLLLLSSQDILNKEFQKIPRGYDPHIVDAFLDTIIHDYREMEANKLLTKREFDEMNSKIEQLEKENNLLKIELEKYKNRLKDIKDTDHASFDNIKLIKKIRLYEKHLWHMGVNPETIK